MQASVKIQPDKLSQTEYLIKDRNDIIIGRFTIMELSDTSKTCNINFKFYRDSGYEFLSDSLTLILKATFKNPSVFKVNIKVLETIDLNPFIDLGFTLEGIFSQNEYFKGEYFDELSFGITRIEYNQMNRYSLVELKGKTITLKNLTPGNAEEVLEYYKRNKSYLEPFEPTRDNNFYTLENQKSFLNKSYREFLSGLSMDLGIFKKDKLIGKIKISRIMHGSLKSGVLGYSIDEYEQGKGYMKESVKLLLGYVFNECDLHRIEASALINNKKSRGVLTGSGFKFLGVNEKYILINGKWEDHAIYYILKEDFESL